jgi:hypothetical protein
MKKFRYGTSLNDVGKMPAQEALGLSSRHRGEEPDDIVAAEYGLRRSTEKRT